jgi:hypothetical protein
MNEKQFKTMYLGEWVNSKCSVKDCNSVATLFVTVHNTKKKPIDEKGYCDLCFQHLRNYQRIRKLNRFEQMMSCPKCRKQTNAYGSFCRHCGNPMWGGV